MFNLPCIRSNEPVHLRLNAEAEQLRQEKELLKEKYLQEENRLITLKPNITMPSELHQKLR